jgi:tRNA (cmo5U34)-methyltransferase
VPVVRRQEIEMADYRWNQSDMAAGYDAGAVKVHPWYVELQDAILQRLPFEETSTNLVVDLGGGSGRLVERILERWPGVCAIVVDQSQAFLDLAAARLERFGDRAQFECCRLQEDWTNALPRPAAAIVSMSAIHHLDPQEKQTCYRRCYEALGSGGILMNGDEVRPKSDAEYRRQVETWAARMAGLIEGEQVTPAMAEGLRKWRARNVDQFGEPRSSGDDCHETAAVQLGYFHDAGFADVDAPWQRELWTLLQGRKAS